MVELLAGGVRTSWGTYLAEGSEACNPGVGAEGGQGLLRPDETHPPRQAERCTNPHVRGPNLTP